MMLTNSSQNEMPCCVPGCSNLTPEWTTPFPRNLMLMESWRAAIKAATGQSSSKEEILPDDALICNMHFEMQQPTQDSINAYQWPSLFVRDNVQLRVEFCRLCFRNDLTDNMFSVEGGFVKGYSLRKMIDKYFGLLKSEKQSGEIDFVCKTCIVRINMTHAFLEDIKQKQAKRQQDENTIQTSTLAVCKKPDQANFQKTDQYQTSSLPDSEQPQQEVISRPKMRKQKRDAMRAHAARHKSVHKNGTTCNLCQAFFNHSKDILIHFERDHPNIKLNYYPCCSCEEIFFTATSKKYHSFFHTDVFKCNQCGRRCGSRTDLTRHTQTHIKTKMKVETDSSPVESDEQMVVQKDSPSVDLVLRQKDEICATVEVNNLNEEPQVSEPCPESQIRRPYNLKRQLKAKYECLPCHLSFKTKFLLQRHEASAMHKKNPSNKKRFVCRRGSNVICNICNETFNHSKNVVIHFKEVHPKTKFKYYSCRSCDEVCFTSKAKYYHSNFHTDVFKCNQCGKRCGSKSDLTRHTKFHYMEKLKVNQDCSLIGSDEQTIVEQEVIPSVKDEISAPENFFQEHDDLEPIEDGIFKEEPQLSEPCDENELQRMQSMRDKYACLDCDVIFDDCLLLKRHQIVMHRKTTSRHPLAYQRGSNVTICIVCNASFNDPKEIVIHFKEVHPEKKLNYYPCLHCEEISFTKFSETYHSYFHTDKFKCNQCGKRCRSKHDLKNHEKIHNKEKDKEKPLACRLGKMTMCFVCNASFNLSKDILDHFKEMHPGKKLEYYPCLDCEEIFFTTNSKALHSHVHTDKYKCNQCEKRCVSYHDLTVHTKTHNDDEAKEKPLACRLGKLTICFVCNAPFNRSKEILGHFKELHPEKKLEYYPCLDCEEIFFTKKSKTLHSHVHTDKFKCNQCEKRCVSYHDFTQHTKTHNDYEAKQVNQFVHRRSKVIKCTVCDASFYHSKHVVNHFKEVHPEKKLTYYPCPHCEEVSFTTKSQSFHFNVHTDKYKCNQCELRFGSRRNLLVHIKSRHTQKNESQPKVEYSCLACDVVYKSEAFLLRHEKSQSHKNKTSSEAYLAYRRGGTGGNVAVCSVCEAQFCPSKDIVNHFKEAHSEMELTYYSCKECEEVFFARSTFYSHTKTHTDKFKCDICGKRHSSMAALKIHEKQHQSSRKKTVPKTAKPTKKRAKLLASRVGGHKQASRCNLCRVSFKHAKEVVTHFKEVHPNTEFVSYTCHFCDDVFFLRTTFVRHLNFHRGKNKCNQCGKAHNTKSLLKIHMRVHHKQVVPRNKVVKQRSLSCKVCHTSFKNSKEVEPHYKEVHPGVTLKLYPCTYCEKVFTIGRSHLHHENLHKDIYKCKQCGKRHGGLPSLKEHEKTFCTKQTHLATRQGGSARRMPTCNVCHASFKHSKEVVTHFKEAHPERKLRSQQCSFCDEVFFNRTSFVRHLNMHKSKHKCSNCNGRFKSTEFLKQHLEANICQVHNTTVKESSTENMSEMLRQSPHGVHHVLENIKDTIQTAEDTIDKEKSGLADPEKPQKTQIAEPPHHSKYLEGILDETDQGIVSSIELGKNTIVKEEIYDSPNDSKHLQDLVDKAAQEIEQERFNIEYGGNTLVKEEPRFSPCS